MRPQIEKGDYWCWASDLGNVYLHSDTNPIVRVRSNGRNRRIWLPRQDQLQEISGLDWHNFDRKCLVYEHVPTKEQAGIRVVMKEKYNKIWGGEDWIANKVLVEQK